jgi:hypothetical protein
MAKQINFTHNGKAWTLEFNARTVKEVQNSGFKQSEIGDKLMVMLPILWHGAFLMHHRFEKAEVIDSMLPLMGDKEALFDKLVQMYSEPIEALIDEPDESVKVDWTASW